jgi:hypothetical protein
MAFILRVGADLKFIASGKLELLTGLVTTLARSWGEIFRELFHTDRAFCRGTDTFYARKNTKFKD